MEWTVALRMHESAGTVIATATLTDDQEQTLAATGQFRPAGPARAATPAQYELAAARALQRLSEALITAASQATGQE